MPKLSASPLPKLLLEKFKRIVYNHHRNNQRILLCPMIVTGNLINKVYKLHRLSPIGVGDSQSISYGDGHNLYLVNGDYKMQTCYFGSFEMNSSIDDFYKSLDNSMHILNIANGRKYAVPDYQKICG